MNSFWSPVIQLIFLRLTSTWESSLSPFFPFSNILQRYQIANLNLLEVFGLNIFIWLLWDNKFITFKSLTTKKCNRFLIITYIFYQAMIKKCIIFFFFCLFCWAYFELLWLIAYLVRLSQLSSTLRDFWGISRFKIFNIYVIYLLFF